MEIENEYLTTPFEIEKIKQRGHKITGFVVMEDFFIPSNTDLDKLTDFIKDCKTIVDIGSGYGLLITKLAKLSPEKNFLGIDTLYWKGNGFPVPEELSNLKFEFNGVEAMAHADKWNKKVKKFDCVICSWMPQGSDWRDMFSILSSKKVILILSQDFNTGKLETYAGMMNLGFKLIGRAWRSSDSLIQLWERK